MSCGCPNYIPVSTLVIKGDKGDKGDPGENGAPGASGAPGPQGEPGGLGEGLIINQGIVKGTDPDAGTLTLVAPEGYALVSAGYGYSGSYSGEYPTAMDSFHLFNNTPSSPTTWVFSWHGLDAFTTGNGVMFYGLCFPV